MEMTFQCFNHAHFLSLCDLSIAAGSGAVVFAAMEVGKRVFSVQCSVISHQ
jgi:hypothetical protein